MIDNSFKKIVLPASLAIFAMFFGAGNLVFPLSLGANSTHVHLSAVMSGFLISGIGLPALGLIATMLYKGDYKKVLDLLGNPLGFAMSAIIIVLLGLLIANPRSCIIAYGTLSTYLPHVKGMDILFKLIFFTGVFLAARYHETVISLIGKILSPIKVSMILLVIIIGASSGHLHQNHFLTHANPFTHAFITGYHTMDLLASLFFAAMVYQFISQKVVEFSIPKQAITRLAIMSTIMGMALVGVVYIGFLYVANLHANLLQGVSTVDILSAANHILFNNVTAILFNLSIAVACFVTSIALTSITSNFIYSNVLKERGNYNIILVITSLIAFVMSNFTFNEIMHIGGIILSVLYPLVLAITVIKLIQALYARKKMNGFCESSKR